MRSSLLLSALLLSSLPLSLARGADANKPHPHRGILQRYERQPPSSYGISVSGVPLDRLRSGKPLLKILSLSSGFKRAVSIQDIPAPPEVVWEKIMDLEHYPQMVEGCARCAGRRPAEQIGRQTLHHHDEKLYGWPACSAAVRASQLYHTQGLHAVHCHLPYPRRPLPHTIRDSTLSLGTMCTGGRNQARGSSACGQSTGFAPVHFQWSISLNTPLSQLRTA
eukprot:scaffold313959_cov40-Tisochrysis_lutea.AAC.1